MFKEIFKRIIELLPKSIRDNIIFEQVIEAYQNELSKDIDTNSLNMSTSKDIYNTLINDYSDLIKVVKLSTNDNILLHLTLITIQGVIVLKISDNSLVQRASIKAVDHHSEEKNIDLIITDNETYLDTTLIKEKDKKVIKYEYNTAVYDKLGTPINIDEEQEKDINFAEEFLVPLDEARFYRTHFNEYIDFLNENRIKEQKRKEDLVMHDNLFTSPFVLNNLEFFIKNEIEEMIEEASGESKGSITLTGGLDQIIKGIEGIIGDSEEIIMSNYLYQALESYLFEVDDILYNKGVIIKRINNEYTLYYIHIENDKIILTNTKLLDNDDIMEIMNSNHANYEVKGLPEFFGLGLKR